MFFNFSPFTTGIFTLSICVSLITSAYAYDGCDNPGRRRVILWRMGESIVALVVFLILLWANDRYHYVVLPNASLIPFVAALVFAFTIILRITPSK